MTKNEFITLLHEALRKQNTADAAEIEAEYEQHFAFKLADGYSEEEISARLGDPKALAAQFEQPAPQQKQGCKPLVIAGLCFADLLGGMFYVLLIAWGIVMVAVSLSSAVLAVCLLGKLNIAGLIPSVPYGCGVILAVCFAALAVLAAVGCIYYAAFLRQLARAFVRFQHNALSSASGKAGLPLLAVNPQFSMAFKRRLRSAALISLVIFAASFILAYIVCTLSAGSMEFWHIWGWFGNIS